MTSTGILLTAALVPALLLRDGPAAAPHATPHEPPAVAAPIAAPERPRLVIAPPDNMPVIVPDVSGMAMPTVPGHSTDPMPMLRPQGRRDKLARADSAGGDSAAAD